MEVDRPSQIDPFIANEVKAVELEAPATTVFPAKYRLLREELEPFWAAIKSWWFWAALVISTILLVGAYQFSFAKSFDAGSSTDRPYMFGYYPTEQFQNFYAYNWTRPSSLVVLPRVGQSAKVKVNLELATRPQGVPPAKIQLLINNASVANFTSPTVAELRKSFSFEYTAENRSVFNTKNDQLEIRLEMDEHRTPGDPRSLGVAVISLGVQGEGLFEAGRPTLPNLELILEIVASVAVLFVLGLRAGWSPRFMLWGSVGLSLLVAIGLVQDRLTTGAGAPYILQSVVICYPLTVIGLRFTGWWLRRKNLPFGLIAMRWLAAIFVLAFVLRVVGLNHPSFQTIDHGFRIHEVAAIVKDPSLIFSRYYNITSGAGVGGVEGRSAVAGQWGLKVQIPYSPLFYLLDLPIGWLTVPNDPSLLYWTNVFAVLLDVFALFFLYIIARQTLGKFGQTAGLIGAFLMCFFPLAYLMPSDGGYNTMLASFLSLWWLAGLTAWLSNSEKPARPRWSSVILNGIVLGLALLAHTATLLLLGSMGAMYLVLLLFWKKGQYRYLCGRMAISYGIGVGFSFTLYYGFYAFGLITSSLPAIAGQIGQGNSIGKDNKVLADFWPSLLAHFHLLPFFVTSAIILWLVYLDLRSRSEPLPEQIKSPSILIYLAWLLTFYLFSLASLKVNLLQKHMLFALPLLALGTGLVAAIAWDYLKGRSNAAVWASRLALTAIVVWYLSAGAYTWYIRAIHYIVPLGTG